MLDWWIFLPMARNMASYVGIFVYKMTLMSSKYCFKPLYQLCSILTFLQKSLPSFQRRTIFGSCLESSCGLRNVISTVNKYHDTATLYRNVCEVQECCVNVMARIRRDFEGSS